MNPLPEIEPELARKGLSADARNALQDVAHGETLGAFHRDLLASKLVTSADPETLMEARWAVLLARYARAGHLTKDEIAEVKHLLPSMDKVGRRVTSEAYQHPYSFYAQASGYEERNLKKWIKAGRERTPIDLPPFDSPADMPSWWGRNMKQRCPARIFAWAGKGIAPSSSALPPAEAAPSTPAPSSPASRAGDAVQSQAPDESDLPAGKGYAATLERWIEAERVAHRFYDQALRAAPFDEGLFEQRRRAYERASEMVRKLSVGKENILATDDEWGKWEDFEEQVARGLAVLNNSLRSIPVRLATKLALPSDLFQSLTQSWHAELDAAFDHLAETDYRASYTAPVEKEDLELEAA